MKVKMTFWMWLAIILLLVLIVSIPRIEKAGSARFLGENEPKKISVESFDPTKEVYSSNEIAYVFFTIKNTLGIPYDVTVKWSKDEKTYFTWSSKSTEQYRPTQIINDYESWIDLSGITGNWDVRLTVEYLYEDSNFKEEHTRGFKVV